MLHLGPNYEKIPLLYLTAIFNAWSHSKITTTKAFETVRKGAVHPQPQDQLHRTKTAEQTLLFHNYMQAVCRDEHENRIKRRSRGRLHWLHF